MVGTAQGVELLPEVLSGIARKVHRLAKTLPYRDEPGT